MRGKRFVIVAALLSAVSSVSGAQIAGAGAQARVATQLVYACVDKSTEYVRIIDHKTMACLSTERPEQWNVRGIEGATGPQGIPGAVGPQGVAGPVGAKGPAGPQGIAGPAGPAGPQGAMGVAGAAGPQGIAGAAGAKGATGATGATGPQGVAGPAGPTGPRGLTGLQGPPGTTTLPANLTAFSNLLGENGYTGGSFRSVTECQLGDILLSVNAYDGGGAYVPADGRLLPINQNTALFSVLGTNFGGDGLTTFGLPDLRAAAPKLMQYSICVAGIFPSRN